MDIININDTFNKLFYIGGVVRDELLGIKSLDVDMTYIGDAIEFAKTLKNAEILQINEPFGTVKVKIDGREIDIASTRCEIYEKKGHLPIVTKMGCSLKDDVLRRDFTINTLAKSVNGGEIIDYTNGMEDLKNKKLKVLHDESFIDDPTRIIRALKFRMRFGFELDENTKKLQENYLKNINCDMCYKRVKKEVLETLGLNLQKCFEVFINEKIYKLVTSNEVRLPNVNIESLVNKYLTDKTYVWLVYAGVLQDLSRFELTKKEQKILDDYSALENLSMDTDFEIYKGFENKSIESILLYYILKNEKIARHYLDNLCMIKISITGKTLEKMGIEPSPKYAECFDFVLMKKLENPFMNLDDEIAAANQYCNS